MMAVLEYVPVALALVVVVVRLTMFGPRSKASKNRK
jgi:hypothetical protein